MYYTLNILIPYLLIDLNWYYHQHCEIITLFARNQFGRLGIENIAPFHTYTYMHLHVGNYMYMIILAEIDTKLGAIHPENDHTWPYIYQTHQITARTEFHSAVTVAVFARNANLALLGHNASLMPISRKRRRLKCRATWVRVVGCRCVQGNVGACGGV